MLELICVNKNCLLHEDGYCGSPCRSEKYFTCKGRLKEQSKVEDTKDYLLFVERGRKGGKTSRRQ